jgi:hypothetical protein
VGDVRDDHCDDGEDAEDGPEAHAGDKRLEDGVEVVEEARGEDGFTEGDAAHGEEDDGPVEADCQTGKKREGTEGVSS